ncbi:uncharacterized protein LOC133918457 isoform X2 [Phragmites australis]|uniref:uncharacterized protein LOC133918457 isoform X2 n=1 Tax=Phragmites australis TaxID=29695 RepID=UPI002D7A265B|nr:uncharacterized protein LOC133918457 isoform X2 [Phragmites australis]
MVVVDSYVRRTSDYHHQNGRAGKLVWPAGATFTCFFGAEPLSRPMPAAAAMEAGSPCRPDGRTNAMEEKNRPEQRPASGEEKNRPARPGRASVERAGGWRASFAAVAGGATHRQGLEPSSRLDSPRHSGSHAPTARDRTAPGCGRSRVRAELLCHATHTRRQTITVTALTRVSSSLPASRLSLAWPPPSTSPSPTPTLCPPPRPMDPDAADLPCVIQALPAHSPSANTLPPPPLVQALPALHSPAKDPPFASAATPASSSRPPMRRPPPSLPPPAPSPPSPRRTRSGGAPEWTAAETLALVAEVAAVDDGWSRSVSAFQKWAMVAENLAASETFASGPTRRSERGNKRAAGECRRRWEALAAEYGAVRRWEVRTGGRYWEMGAAARRKAGLPAEFDAEVYGAMDALIRVEEALLADAAGGVGGGEDVEGLVGSGGGVEVREEDGGEVEVAEDEVQEDESAQEEEQEEEEEGEDGEEMQADVANADASNDLGREMGTNSEPEKRQNNAWELANKLHENAQHIHTILQEEANEDAGQNHVPCGSMSPDAMETSRQKGDDLIKSLGGLVSYLNQFTELIMENGFESVAAMT